MKTLLTILMALFISHISFATNVPNAEAGKNGDRQNNSEKPIAKTTENRNVEILPCTQTFTENASYTFLDCNNVSQTIGASVTCSASGSTCEAALYAAAECAHQTAWTNIFSQVPVCPPAE